MSIYDLPAGLSYIFQMTNKKISYIGHSQGTTQMWAALSERKENVQKYLKNFISLAPVVYLNHCKSNLINFLVRNEVDLVMKALNIHEILSPNWFSSVAGVKVIDLKLFSSNLLFCISSCNYENILEIIFTKVSIILV